MIFRGTAERSLGFSAWSPDGRSLAVEASGALLLVTNGVAKTLTPPGVNVSAFGWFPDSSKLVVSELGSDPPGHALRPVADRVYIITVDGSTRPMNLSAPIQFSYVSWIDVSADGATFLAVAEPPTTFNERFGLVRIAVSGGMVDWVLEPKGERSIEAATFIDSDHALVGISFQPKGSLVPSDGGPYAVNLDTGHLTELPSPGPVLIDRIQVVDGSFLAGGLDLVKGSDSFLIWKEGLDGSSIRDLPISGRWPTVSKSGVLVATKVLGPGQGNELIAYPNVLTGA
jgi:hypothetical protein